MRGEPLGWGRRSLRAHRREVQMIFQDPTGDLNARQTIYEAVDEGVRIQRVPGDEEQLVAWMGSINDIRLVLGTRLDVTEDDRGNEVPDDHPDAQLHAVYHYLGWLEEQIVEALAEGLPG